MILEGDDMSEDEAADADAIDEEVLPEAPERGSATS